MKIVCAIQKIWSYLLGVYKDQFYQVEVISNVSFYVCRETKEECGLDVTNLDKVGVIMFEFIGEPQLMEVHVFRTHCYTGTPVETEGKVTRIKTVRCDTLLFYFHRNETTVVFTF